MYAQKMNEISSHPRKKALHLFSAHLLRYGFHLCGRYEQVLVLPVGVHILMNRRSARWAMMWSAGLRDSERVYYRDKEDFLLLVASVCWSI